MEPFSIAQRKGQFASTPASLSLPKDRTSTDMNLQLASVTASRPIEKKILVAVVH